MKWIIILAAANGFIAVAAGAFGAHALRERLTPAQLDVYETAARYQLPHAVAALVAAALLPGCRLARGAGWCFIAGSAVFAATLYALALGGPRWLGAITPFGGAGMLVGWTMLFVAGVRWRYAASPPGQ